MPCKTHTFAHVKSFVYTRRILRNGMPSANLSIASAPRATSISRTIQGVEKSVGTVGPRLLSAYPLIRTTRENYHARRCFPSRDNKYKSSPTRLCNKSAHPHTHASSASTDQVLTRGFRHNVCSTFVLPSINDGITRDKQILARRSDLSLYSILYEFTISH